MCVIFELVCSCFEVHRCAKFLLLMRIRPRPSIHVRGSSSMSATFSLMCLMLTIEFRGRQEPNEAVVTFLFTDCVSAAQKHLCMLPVGRLVRWSPRLRLSSPPNTHWLTIYWCSCKLRCLAKLQNRANLLQVIEKCFEDERGIGVLGHPFASRVPNHTGASTLHLLQCMPLTHITFNIKQKVSNLAHSCSNLLGRPKPLSRVSWFWALDSGGSNRGYSCYNTIHATQRVPRVFMCVCVAFDAFFRHLHSEFRHVHKVNCTLPCQKMARGTLIARIERRMRLKFAIQTLNYSEMMYNECFPVSREHWYEHFRPLSLPCACEMLVSNGRFWLIPAVFAQEMLVFASGTFQIMWSMPIEYRLIVIFSVRSIVFLLLWQK